jgi:hypothetical protein
VAASAFAASQLRRDRLSAGMRTWRYHSKPVPAGISRPIVTFSFSPRK